MIYVDSSVLLEMYLVQPQRARAHALLSGPSPKVACWLLAVEVPIVLRRVLGATPANQTHLAQALTRFDADLKGISLMADLPDLAARIRQDQRFAKCRALDAIHAGTALQLQQMTNHPVHVATFDQRLSQLSVSLGLSLA